MTSGGFTRLYFRWSMPAYRFFAYWRCLAGFGGERFLLEIYFLGVCGSARSRFLGSVDIPVSHDRHTKPRPRDLGIFPRRAWSREV